MKKVGFLGVGNVGGGMCKNLIEAGNHVTIFDINTKAMERFAGKASLAKNVLELLHESDTIFLSLPNSNTVESIVAAFIEAGVKGKTIIDTSTSYPGSTKNLAAQIKVAGGAMIDAPLLAGPAEAESGDLILVVGGDEEEVNKVSDLLHAISKSYSYLGESGSGHLMKLAVNFCSLSQALILAQLYPVMEQFGIGKKTVYDTLNNDIFNNWIFQFYSDKYVKEDYRLDFALSLGLKDLSYMKRLYEEINIPGFLLDGALDLCRVSLLGEKENEVRDFSYPAQTMADLIERSQKK